MISRGITSILGSLYRGINTPKEIKMSVKKIKCISFYLVESDAPPALTWEKSKGYRVSSLGIDLRDTPFPYIKSRLNGLKRSFDAAISCLGSDLKEKEDSNNIGFILKDKEE